MKIPKQAIAEFKEIYERKHGIRLSEEKVQNMAMEFLKLYSLSQGYKYTNGK